MINTGRASPTPEPAVVGSLLSVNVGLPRNVDWNGRTVYTGIWKSPVPGPQAVRRLNIDGDGQGDAAGHGGENRAVMVYQIDSYRYWEQHLGRDDFSYGQFGENLTVTGMADTDVCIGDRYRIGTAEFEVTQPRVTCFRVGLRLGRPDMPSLLVEHHRPGFYLRVITEGVIAAGDPILRTASEPHRISVADADALLYLPDPDLQRVREALDIPALSRGWQGSFNDLLAAAADGRAIAGPTVGSAPAWSGLRSLRIVDVTPESRTVISLRLADPAGTALPAARAGQYLTVRVPIPERPVIRSYSLSGAPDAGTYRIGVKREENGLASAWLHEHAQVGDTLEVAAARGDFMLSPGSGPVVLVSAGVGATPLLAMLYELGASGIARPVWWFHAARGPADHAFAREVASLVAALPAGHLHIRYSRPPADAEQNDSGAAWHTGTFGHLDAEAFADAAVPADADAFLCGPERFMGDMTDALVAAGLDPGRIRTELFGARTAINPGIVGAPPVAPHPPISAPTTGPAVTFVRSGLTTRFGPGYPSLLEFAEACDVPTRWSCRTGVCHTCSTPLLSGSVRYRPAPLEPPIPGDALVCCSTPDTDVVLDL